MKFYVLLALFGLIDAKKKDVHASFSNLMIKADEAKKQDALSILSSWSEFDKEVSLKRKGKKKDHKKGKKGHRSFVQMIASMAQEEAEEPKKDAFESFSLLMN